MSLIPKRPDDQKTRTTITVDITTAHALVLTDYTAFLAETDVAYVLDALLEQLAGDKDFVKWRTARASARPATPHIVAGRVS